MTRIEGASIHAAGTADETASPWGAAGLVRGRLISRLTDPDAYSVAWVVAPAGSGKSRLLAHTAGAFAGSVAWCGTPDPIPRTEAALINFITSALVPESGAGPLGSEPTIGSLCEALAGPGPAVLVVIDDAHLFEGSDAEAALASLIQRAPARMRLVLASRVSPDIDLSRLRVSGKLVEIGPEDLRFRTWEVEELFRDVYGDPLLPEDVAALARRTGGWAAYLQLFFLATARKPQTERRRMLSSLGGKSRLVSEYLGRHALAGLSPELQDFLVRTSVLRRPTGALCDELLGRTGGSGGMLAELERRQLFTERVDDDAYLYHTVLLSYLDAKLVETIGIAAARAEHQRAALLLEREGNTEDALAAYAKAEDWEGVAGILGHAGSPAGGLGEAWIEALPPTVVETDALLLQVRARRALARGALGEAAQILRDAESVAVSAAVADRCRTEREQILVWAEPDRPAADDWVGLIRKATQRQPIEAYRQATKLPGAPGKLAEGFTALVGGDVRVALRAMRAAAAQPDAAPAMVAGALLGVLVATVMQGRELDRTETERVREEVEASSIPWLDRVARATLAAGEPGSEAVLDDFVDACQREGDRWGAALIGLIGAVALLARGERAKEAADRAARSFSEVGAGALEAQATGYAALAALRAGDREAAERNAHQTRTLAGLLDVPGAAGVAELVLSVLSDDRRGVDRAGELLAGLGSWDWFAALAGVGANGSVHPPPAGGPAGGDPAAAGAVPTAGTGARVRTLGGFSLEVGGQRIDETAAKPMERALLHLLCVRAGELVHREELIEALWPEADPDAGLHRLQVAVSAVRRLLGVVGPERGQMLAREGDGYRLTFPPGSDIDSQNLAGAAQRAAQARASGDPPAESAALAEVLATYTGPLLPGDGPADWVVGWRDRLQATVVEAASRLASLRMQLQDPAGAAEAARAGVAVDRYRDELWKVLIDASEKAGNHAESGQARRAYEAVLDELGV